VKPPWGALAAIDMNHASIAWHVSLGEVPGSGLAHTGGEDYGGPVATAGGLVFIGAAKCDRKFHAFDSDGRAALGGDPPGRGERHPRPVLGRRKGVAIAAGGGKGEPPAAAATSRLRSPDRTERAHRGRTTLPAPGTAPAQFARPS
jgi:quinoprotein glucose dehydrogenase